MKFTLVFTVLLAMLGALLSGVSAQRDGCICTLDYKPVCATNGRTYSNECRMKCSGASLKTRGKC